MDYASSSAQKIAIRQIEDVITHFRVGGFLATRNSEVKSCGAVPSRLFAAGSEAMEAIEDLARLIYERQQALNGHYQIVDQSPLEPESRRSGPSAPLRSRTPPL